MNRPSIRGGGPPSDLASTFTYLYYITPTLYHHPWYEQLTKLYLCTLGALDAHDGWFRVLPCLIGSVQLIVAF